MVGCARTDDEIEKSKEEPTYYPSGSDAPASEIVFSLQEWST